MFDFVIAASRPKHLLNGKVFCGSCGGAIGNIGKDYLACTSSQRQGTCLNRKSIKRSTVDAMVTDGLRHELMDPVMFRAFADAFTDECDRGAIEAERGKGSRLGELVKVRQKLDKLVEAVANGLKSSTIQIKLTELERQEAALVSETSEIEAPAKRMPPDLAELYRAEIWRRAEAPEPSRFAEDRELLRCLIDRVTLMPEPASGGLSLELTGDISAIIGLALNANSGRKPRFSAADQALFACSVNVVAGTENHRQLTPIRVNC